MTSVASQDAAFATTSPAHPRTLGWIKTTALAMGGSNQSLFILAALFVGQGDISGQGSVAVPLLMFGLVLAWAAAPGWTELVLMYPNRVGGISSTCAEAFKPYSAMLANLTGVCYWWGWVPTCGLTAILSASAIHAWYLPQVPVDAMAVGLVLLFTALNLCGIAWASRLGVAIASASALLALLSGLAPVIAGKVDWTQATSFHLNTPFAGSFGALTSLMAGLYLIGFAAPAFEAAACHVGETVDPARNLPRAMLASAVLAALYFIVLPLVWLGTLGPEPLGRDLALELGPTFAPVFGAAAKSAAIWFMVLSMFSGTLQPLAGAARCLAQLSEDGLLPRSFARRTRTDAPVVATLLTAGMAIVFLLIGDPIWLVAAANFTYLISIAMPSIAVWLLRRDQPTMPRPYRAPRGTIRLGLAAAAVWGLSCLLGFEQFGLPTVVVGVGFAYSGALLYAWRKISDRRRAGLPAIASMLQIRLTGAMLLVLMLDSSGYLLAVNHLPQKDSPLLAGLSDLFVAVAMLSITVALVLPGVFAHGVRQVSEAAKNLATGTMTELARAMQSLGRGDLDAAHAHMDLQPVEVHSRDEVGEMARSFNRLQQEIRRAVTGLDGARDGLRHARLELTEANQMLSHRVDELNRAEQELSGVLHSIDNVVWSLSAGSLHVRYISPAVERIHGRRPQEFIDDTELWLDVVHEEDRAAFGIWLATLPAQGSATIQYRIVRPDGSLRWIENRARLIVDDDGQPQRIDGVGSDVTERRRQETELAYLANNDPLTDLPNRNRLRVRVAQALDQAHRCQQRLALLFLDLDGFKFINDSYGHALGDVMLTAVAVRLLRCVRSAQTVARLGGDEFVVVMSDVSGIDEAEQIARTLLQALCAPLVIEGRALHVTGSIGISMFPDDGDTYELLLKHADLAMYRAKELGRNGVQRYLPEMSDRARERVELEAALRLALEQGQLELHYQPQIELADGRVSGVESLLRWKHPELGPVSPARIVPLAEETGLILPLGEWALRTACLQLRQWHLSGHHELTMAVNISARQINRGDFAARVMEILSECQLAPRHLQLELTETALISNAESVIGTLRKLKSLGISLALDDFGTGYSSLGYLARFPIDTLKIDKSFINELSNSAEAASITRAILAMSRSLNVKTIGEGVETSAQQQFLLLNGCDAVQGHLHSPALTADAALDYITEANAHRDGKPARALASRQPRH